jgi:hypothetical protein
VAVPNLSALPGARRRPHRAVLPRGDADAW